MATPPTPTRPPRAQEAGAHRRVMTRRGRERGSVTLEMAILFPLVLTLTFGTFQAVMFLHARAMCAAATQAGLRAARAADAPAGTGPAAASAYVQDTAADTLTGATLTETRTPTTVTLTCTGQALAVFPIPGLSLRVTATSTAERERFTTP